MQNIILFETEPLIFIMNYTPYGKRLSQTVGGIYIIAFY